MGGAMITVQSHDVCMLQVKHKYTNQVMVMKEMRRATKEAKFTFLQEVWYCALQVGCQSALPAKLHKTIFCGPM